MTEGDRPKAAIGHVTLRVQDVQRSCAFYAQLGLRRVVEKEELAILELRGGTHLLLFRAKGKPKRGPIRSFDIMVDDAEDHRAALTTRVDQVDSCVNQLGKYGFSVRADRQMLHWI